MWPFGESTGFQNVRFCMDTFYIQYMYYLNSVPPNNTGNDMWVLSVGENVVFQNVCFACINLNTFKRLMNNYMCLNTRCNQGFLSPSRLTQHKHTHCRQCLYTCFAKDCSNSYKWPQDLLRHVGNHTAVVLKCKLCTYSNTECHLITQHQNLHSDVKKF